MSDGSASKFRINNYLVKTSRTSLNSYLTSLKMLFPPLCVYKPDITIKYYSECETLPHEKELNNNKANIRAYKLFGEHFLTVNENSIGQYIA